MGNGTPSYPVEAKGQPLALPRLLAERRPNSLAVITRPRLPVGAATRHPPRGERLLEDIPRPLARHRGEDTPHQPLELRWGTVRKQRWLLPRGRRPPVL